MKKIHAFLVLVFGLFFATLCIAQAPAEISFKLLDSKDYLSEKIDQLYSYRFKRKLSDKTIAEIATLRLEYNVALKRESFSNQSASVYLSFTPKKESFSATNLYFLFVKEDNQWKFDGYTLGGAETFEYHFEAMQQALMLYKKKDYAIGAKSKEEVEWQLSNMRPKRLFALDVIKKRHGIAIALALNNNFVNKLLRVRDLAYAIKYYSPSKSQVRQLEDYWAFALASIEDNIETLKPNLATLEKVLKSAQKPSSGLRKWLDQKAIDWAIHGVEYVDTIGFAGHCDGCYDLVFANLGRYRKGLLYIPNKEKLLPLKHNSYLTLLPIEGAWYYYTTY